MARMVNFVICVLPQGNINLKIQIHATIEMNLEDTMLGQRSQIQKNTYFMIPLMRNVPKRQVTWRPKVDSQLPSLEVGDGE